MIDYKTAKMHFLRGKVDFFLPYLYEYTKHINPSISCSQEEFSRLFPIWIAMPVLNLETGKVYPDKNKRDVFSKTSKIFNFLDEKYLK